MGSVYGMRLRELLALTDVSDVRFVEPTWAAEMHACPRLCAFALGSVGILPGVPALGLARRSNALLTTSLDGPVCGRVRRHRQPLRPIESNVVRPQVELRQTTRLLTQLADDDRRWDGPEMTPQDMRALIQLQAQLRPGRCAIPLSMTNAALLRRRVDTEAADLVHRDVGDCIAFVHAPRFGGWLGGVRYLVRPEQPVC